MEVSLGRRLASDKFDSMHNTRVLYQHDTCRSVRFKSQTKWNPLLYICILYLSRVTQCLYQYMLHASVQRGNIITDSLMIMQHYGKCDITVYKHLISDGNTTIVTTTIVHYTWYNANVQYSRRKQ